MVHRVGFGTSRKVYHANLLTFLKVGAAIDLIQQIRTVDVNGVCFDCHFIGSSWIAPTGVADAIHEKLASVEEFRKLRVRVWIHADTTVRISAMLLVLRQVHCEQWRQFCAGPDVGASVCSATRRAIETEHLVSLRECEHESNGL